VGSACGRSGSMTGRDEMTFQTRVPLSCESGSSQGRGGIMAVEVDMFPDSPTSFPFDLLLLSPVIFLLDAGSGNMPKKHTPTCRCLSLLVGISGQCWGWGCSGRL
jgi:hypothetical protein